MSTPIKPERLTVEEVALTASLLAFDIDVVAPAHDAREAVKRAIERARELLSTLREYEGDVLRELNQEEADRAAASAKAEAED